MEGSIKGERLLRIKEVLALIPVSKSTWWAGVKSGRYPKPIRHLGPRITAWKESDIKAVIDGTFQSAGE